MSFKVFVLCLLALLVGIFAYLRMSAAGDPNSYFNTHTRYELGKYKVMRWLLGMHNDGDARAEYLFGDGPIVIEVVQPTGVSIDNGALQDFASKVTQYTGRETQIVQTDNIPGGTVTDADLDVFVAQHRRRVALGTTNLFVMYTEDYAAADNEIGRTYDEYGIVLSHKRLVDLVQNSAGDLPKYEESTLLHEFGHQLGLPHNTNNDCVMAVSVESPEKLEHYFSDVTPTSFCDLELGQLNDIKASLQ